MGNSGSASKSKRRRAATTTRGAVSAAPTVPQAASRIASTAPGTKSSSQSRQVSSGVYGSSRVGSHLSPGTPASGKRVEKHAAASRDQQKATTKATSAGGTTRSSFATSKTSSSVSATSSKELAPAPKTGDVVVFRKATSVGGSSAATRVSSGSAGSSSAASSTGLTQLQLPPAVGVGSRIPARLGSLSGKRRLRVGTATTTVAAVPTPDCSPIPEGSVLEVVDEVLAPLALAPAPATQTQTPATSRNEDDTPALPIPKPGGSILAPGKTVHFGSDLSRKSSFLPESDAMRKEQELDSQQIPAAERIAASSGIRSALIASSEKGVDAGNKDKNSDALPSIVESPCCVSAASTGSRIAGLAASPPPLVPEAETQAAKPREIASNTKSKDEQEQQADPIISGVDMEDYPEIPDCKQLDDNAHHSWRLPLYYRSAFAANDRAFGGTAGLHDDDPEDEDDELLVNLHGAAAGVQLDDDVEKVEHDHEAELSKQRKQQSKGLLPQIMEEDDYEVLAQALAQETEDVETPAATKLQAGDTLLASEQGSVTPKGVEICRVEDDDREVPRPSLQSSCYSRAEPRSGTVQLPPVMYAAAPVSPPHDQSHVHHLRKTCSTPSRGVPGTSTSSKVVFASRVEGKEFVEGRAQSFGPSVAAVEGGDTVGEKHGLDVSPASSVSSAHVTSSPTPSHSPARGVLGFSCATPSSAVVKWEAVVRARDYHVEGDEATTCGRDGFNTFASGIRPPTPLLQQMSCVSPSLLSVVRGKEHEAAAQREDEDFTGDAEREGGENKSLSNDNLELVIRDIENDVEPEKSSRVKQGRRGTEEKPDGLIWRREPLTDADIQSRRDEEKEDRIPAAPDHGSAPRVEADAVDVVLDVPEEAGPGAPPDTTPARKAKGVPARKEEKLLPESNDDVLDSPASCSNMLKRLIISESTAQVDADDTFEAIELVDRSSYAPRLANDVNSAAASCRMFEEGTSGSFADAAAVNERVPGGMALDGQKMGQEQEQVQPLLPLQSVVVSPREDERLFTYDAQNNQHVRTSSNHTRNTPPVHVLYADLLGKFEACWNRKLGADTEKTDLPHFRIVFRRTLEKLPILPVPATSWVKKAFANFDPANTGFVSKTETFEILVQTVQARCKVSIRPEGMFAEEAFLENEDERVDATAVAHAHQAQNGFAHAPPLKPPLGQDDCQFDQSGQNLLCDHDGVPFDRRWYLDECYRAFLFERQHLDGPHLQTDLHLHQHSTNIALPFANIENALTRLFQSCGETYRMKPKHRSHFRVPPSRWFEQAMANFDPDDRRVLEFKDMQEIAWQFVEAHLVWTDIAAVGLFHPAGGEPGGPRTEQQAPARPGHAAGAPTSIICGDQTRPSPSPVMRPAAVARGARGGLIEGGLTHLYASPLQPTVADLQFAAHSPPQDGLHMQQPVGQPGPPQQFPPPPPHNFYDELHHAAQYYQNHHGNLHNVGDLLMAHAAQAHEDAAFTAHLEKMEVELSRAALKILPPFILQSFHEFQAGRVECPLPTLPPTAQEGGGGGAAAAVTTRPVQDHFCCSPPDLQQYVRGLHFGEYQLSRRATLNAVRNLFTEVPQLGRTPSNRWCEGAFDNFDGQREGAIPVDYWCEIIRQYCNQQHGFRPENFRVDVFGEALKANLHFHANYFFGATNYGGGADKSVGFNMLHNSDVPVAGDVHGGGAGGGAALVLGYNYSQNDPRMQPPQHAAPAASSASSSHSPPGQQFMYATTQSPPQQHPLQLSPHQLHKNPAAEKVPLSERLFWPVFPNPTLNLFETYEFAEKKGKGAFGEVCQVRHIKTQQGRACKHITIKNKSQLNLVHTEIKIMQRLDHPNILRMHEVHYDERQKDIYLILELCAGGSIFERLIFHSKHLSRPMSEKQSARYCQQLLSALAYCHQQNIVHRDLKPDNILFLNRKAEGVLKVIDFGLADYLSNIEKAKKPLPNNSGRYVMPRAGTPHYMAPEMHSVAWYDLKADLFAVGIILHQMLTGTHPFFTPGKDTARSSKHKIIACMVEWPPELWRNVSQEARMLVKDLLRPNPKHRLSAAEALAHGWFAQFASSSTMGSNPARKDSCSSTSSSSSKVLEKKLHRGDCSVRGPANEVVAAGAQPQPSGSSSSSGGWVGVSSKLARKREQQHERARYLLQKLFRFPREASKLKQVVLRIIAHNIDIEQVGDLHEMFLFLDQDRDGIIGYDDLVQAFDRCYLTLPDAASTAYFLAAGTVLSPTGLFGAVGPEQLPPGQPQPQLGGAVVGGPVVGQLHPLPPPGAAAPPPQQALAVGAVGSAGHHPHQQLQPAPASGPLVPTYATHAAGGGCAGGIIRAAGAAAATAAAGGAAPTPGFNVAAPADARNGNCDGGNRYGLNFQQLAGGLGEGAAATGLQHQQSRRNNELSRGIHYQDFLAALLEEVLDLTEHREWLSFVYHRLDKHALESRTWDVETAGLAALLPINQHGLACTKEQFYYYVLA